MSLDKHSHGGNFELRLNTSKLCKNF